MSNPFTQVYDDLRSPYLHEKKAKKDYDGDGKVESGSKEHAGVVHNAIQRKKGGKPDGKDTRKEEYIRNSLLKRVEEKLEFRSKLESIAEELPVPDHIKRKQQQAKPAPSSPSVAPAGAGTPPQEPVDPLDDQIAHLKKRMEFKKLKQAERLMDTDNDSVDTKSGAVKEAMVNTPECEKKPEKEKDMRGTYAKLNLVKNKIRSMGCKNPIVMTDDIEDVKEDKTENWDGAKPGKPNSQYNKDGTKKVKKEEEKKPYPGYNPQKGVGPEFKP